MTFKSNIYHFNVFRKLSHYSFCIFDIQEFHAEYPQFKTKHAVDFYTLFVVKNAKGIIEVNRSKFELKRNSVILVSPYEEYDVTETSMVGKVVFFCQDFYTEEFNITRLLKVFARSALSDRNTPVIVPGKKYSELEKITSFIYNEYSHKHNTANSSAIIRSYLNILIMRLISFKWGKPEKKSSVTDSIILKFSHLLEANYNLQHNTGFYADALHISQVKLNTILKQSLNISAKNLIQNKLMAEARKMLVATDMSASEIAYKLNFHDNSYFTKVFLKYHNITPGRFRSAHKKYHK